MTEAQKPIKVEISHKTIIFTTTFFLGLWFLFYIRDIIILIFLSLILLAALLKPVEWFNSKGTPRVLSVLLVYIILISIIAGVSTIIVPPLISQTSDFISKLPVIIDGVKDFLIFNKIPIQDLPQELAKQISGVVGNIVAISTAIFSSVFLMMTLFVITFYLLLEWKSFVRLAASPFSGRQEKKVINLISKIENGLGLWVRGQLMLSLIVGIVTYLGLLVLNIPFALPLALIAGIFEIIPIIGPIISAIPAILVGLTLSPVVGLAVAALFLLVQQLENHIIVPMVMSKVVGLQPPIIIVALLIGAKLAGIGGAFLAVPVIVVAKIIAKDLLSEEQSFEDSFKEQQI